MRAYSYATDLLHWLTDNYDAVWVTGCPSIMKPISGVGIVTDSSTWFLVLVSICVLYMRTCHKLLSIRQDNWRVLLNTYVMRVLICCQLMTKVIMFMILHFSWLNIPFTIILTWEMLSRTIFASLKSHGFIGIYRPHKYMYKVRQAAADGWTDGRTDNIRRYRPYSLLKHGWIGMP